MTLMLNSVSISAALRMTASNWSATGPQLCGVAYREADLSRWALLRRKESTAVRSKHCTSRGTRKSPRSRMSTRYEVIPAEAKLPLMPRSNIRSRSSEATASDMPPAPV